MKDSVIFDMDGVLLDSERIAGIAWQTVGEKMRLPDIGAALKSCIGRNDTDTRAFLRGKYGAAFSYEEFIDATEREFETLVAAGGLPLKDGAREILGWLADTGVRIGLATSSRRKITLGHLDHTGLFPYFNAVVTGDMIRHGKPDPEIYLLACEMLGAAPESCFAVEDSPNGVKSAHAAGLKVIMVPDQIAPTPELERLLHRKFDTLLDVRAYFETL